MSVAGKRISVFEYVSSNNEETEDNKTSHSNHKWISQEESLKHEEDIAESGRIFLRNLSYTTIEDDIQKLFEKYGIKYCSTCKIKIRLSYLLYLNHCMQYNSYFQVR